MSQSFFSVFIGFLCLFLIPRESDAAAVIVFDPGVFARLGSEALQLQNQLTVLKQHLNAIKQLNPSQFKWSNAQDLINQLGGIMEQSSGLSYSAKNLDKEFRQLFPGFLPPINFDKTYERRTANALGTLNGVLKMLGKSAENFQKENALLTFLQAQEKGASGQTQAIQAAAQIASEQVSQLQLLRQTLMAQTTAQSAYFANQIQNEASSKAQLKQLIKSGKTKASAYWPR